VTIPKGGSGQVQVTYQNALRTMSARAKNGDSELASGTMITVVDRVGSTLIVEPMAGDAEA